MTNTLDSYSARRAEKSFLRSYQFHLKRGLFQSHIVSDQNFGVSLLVTFLSPNIPAFLLFLAYVLLFQDLM